MTAPKNFEKAGRGFFHEHFNAQFYARPDAWMRFLQFILHIHQAGKLPASFNVIQWPPLGPDP